MLAEDVRNVIKNLYAEFGNYEYVARITNISIETIKEIVQDLHVKDKAKPDPKSKLSTRTLNRIRRASLKLLADGQKVTPSKIQKHCDLVKVGLNTIGAALRSLNMDYVQSKKSYVPREIRR